MADNLTKQQRKTLKELRQDFDVLPGYADILRKAAVFDWSTQEIIHAVVHSETFRKQYPGIMQGGQLADFLTGQANATLSVQTLAQAVGNYKAFEKQYEDALQDFPQAGPKKLTRDMLATLIRQEKSPDEFRAALSAVQTVKANPELFKTWEQIAKTAGIPKKFNPFEAAARVADQKFYDVYEAARLENMGLGLGAQDALKVAKSLTNVDAQGRSTGIIDTARLADLVAKVQAQSADIGPEMEKQGISRLDLSKWIATGGASDPTLSIKLEQLVATKRNQGAYVAGSQARKGPGGGVTTYAPERTAAY